MENVHAHTPKRIVALDGLRGFSALYVVVFHILHQPKFFESFGPIAHSAILAGASMVQVFFVVSGYSISKSISDLISHTKKPKRLFLMNRFFRIFPLWAALLTLMLIQHQIEIKTYFANLFFFFGDMTPGSRLFPIFLSWSLQAEVIFYILAALCVQIIFKLSKRNLFIIWLLAIFTAQLWRSFAYRYFPDSYLPDGFFISQMMYFVAGIFIEKFTRERHSIETYFHKTIFHLFELVFICLFLVFNFLDLNVLKIVLAPLAVILTLSNSSWLGRLMSMKAFVILGLYSYGIYLLQDISRGHIGVWFGSTLSLPQELFLSLGLTILLAVAAYFLIEKPALYFGKFLSRKI